MRDAPFLMGTKFTASIRLLWRMLRRDWRAGELSVLGVALVLAVAALTSVGFLTDRVAQALKQESHQLLGGDLLLSADHPWAESIVQSAVSQRLTFAHSVSFPSMVSTSAGAQLADVKAVSDGYPLRGRLRVAPALNAADVEAVGIPPVGEVWPDERLATTLAVHPGDRVILGQSQPRVGQVLTVEPDRGMNVMALAPRLMINLADLPATGLVQAGSRITYRLHLAGAPADIQAFDTWVRERLGRGETIESLDNARPEVRVVIERAQRFLRLAALLAVVLAAIAVGLAAQRYMRRHLDACAVMRCMGAREAQLLLIHGGEFMLFGLLATVVGCVLGYAVQAVMLAQLAGLLFASIPPPGWLPWLHGVLVGLVLLAGFALPPLLRLKSVPTVRVLRREFSGTDEAAVATWLSYALGIVALAALMLWIAGEVRLGAIVLGGFAGAFLLYGLLATALLSGLGRIRPAGHGYGWRHGLVNLRRHRQATVVQALALGLGLTALLLLTVARGDLLDTWRKKAPPDAPNRFVINIQPEQRTEIASFFRAQGLDAPVMEPMIRARLLAVNGQAVSANSYQDDRAKRLVEREFNLSWGSDLPSGNRVVAGQWHGDAARASGWGNNRTSDSGGVQFSVEQGLAETLGVKVGDQLDYQIAGQPFSGTVSSLRKLDWDSMRVNFFVIATPGALEKFPASYISSFHLPAGLEGASVALVKRFPNLTVIDVGGLLVQLQRTLDQVAGAVQLVFGFALLAGVVVLFAALQASSDERRHELAVLRALGARGAQLRAALIAEFLALGALAGTLGALGAAALGWALAYFVFRLPYVPNPQLWLYGVLAGWVLVGVGQAFGMRSILREPALTSLRGG